MEEIYVLITMDVEPALPIDRPPASTGPLNYEDSRRFIKGYSSMALSFGYPVTYMIHPEAATAHPDLFVEEEAKGACLGLHLHPWKFGDGHYKDHFGGLSETSQIAILSEAIAVWHGAMKRRPEYFRPGTFSANDNTFGTLERLGFLGGSISIPGRVYPDMNSVWAGAVPDPHFANRYFRQMPGDLNFVNIPLSVDFSEQQDRGGRLFYWDLRPDWQNADYRRISINIVKQVIKRCPTIPIIHMVTHNDNNFLDPNDRVCKNFRKMLTELTNAIKQAGKCPIGATFAEITEMVSSKGQRTHDFVYAHAEMLNG